MTDTALRRALWAVTRVAGAATLLGCAPGTLGTHIPEDAPPSAYDDVPEPDRSCDELLADLVVAAETGEHVDGLTDDTAECCESLIDEIETSGQWPTEPEDQSAQWVCCEALGYPEGLACTPWGPPAPPAMLAPRSALA